MCIRSLFQAAHTILLLILVYTCDNMIAYVIYVGPRALRISRALALARVALARSVYLARGPRGWPSRAPFHLLLQAVYLRLGRRDAHRAGFLRCGRCRFEATDLFLKLFLEELKLLRGCSRHGFARRADLRLEGLSNSISGIGAALRYHANQR